MSSGTEEDKLRFRKTLAEVGFSSFFNYNSSRKNLLNIPKEEYDALIALSKNTDIIISRPDKGSGVIIMNRTDYLAKMENILSDTSKFKLANNQDIYKISRTIETRVRNYLRDKVKKPGYITETQYTKFYPNGSRIGVMYGQPKVHKPGAPLRPVCSAIGTATYDLGKYLAEVIAPAKVSSHGTDLHSTFTFVDQIKDVDMTGLVMVSYDVRSLFTNVPLQRTIDICMDRMYRSETITPPTIPEDVLRKLISLCVCNNTFVFDGKVYEQIDGVAMGSSLGPVLANIWMAHLEENHMLIEQSVPQPLHYRRYADDTFCLFKTLEDAYSFLEFINSVDPSTKFDIEIESEQKLPFLDTVVSRVNGQQYPVISTYVKPTDKGLFYNFASFVPSKYKGNLVGTLTYRAYKIASNYNIFNVDIQKIREKFRKNGFSISFVDNCIGTVLNRLVTPTPPPAVMVQRREVLLSLPFLGPLSYIIKRRLQTLVHKYYPTVQLKVVFRRGYSLRNLFSFTDKFPLKCLSGVVYSIHCKNCGPSQAYIGKTKNTLYERFYGSNGHLHPSSSKSALLRHMDTNPLCEFEFDSIKILDQCEKDLKLRYMESIYLKFDKQSLNTQEWSIPLNVM